MADFTSVLFLSSSVYVTLRKTVGGSGDVNKVRFSQPTHGLNAIKRYIQRVFDTNLNKFCYYETPIIITGPISTLTTPNHTNNILSGSHEVVKQYYRTTSDGYQDPYNGSLQYSVINPFSINEPFKRYVQRIYDTGLNQYCYYVSSNIKSVPISTETTPNHTNNIKEGSHEIVMIST